MSCEKLQVRCPTCDALLVKCPACGVILRPEIFVNGSLTQETIDYVANYVLEVHNKDVHGVAKEKSDA